ncbi:MAG: putative large transcriptional regulator [Actinomycetia bacterium]|nr:putative large transcriptional regulator [Actinomycetes bacterium]
MAMPARRGVDGDAELALGAPAFVGRDRELAVATRALARPPALVLIEGEAGIGKTRLLAELLTASAGTAGRVLVAACPQFREPHTLGPVVDAIRQATTGVGELRLSDLAGALRPLLPEWSASLPPSPEPAEDATVARHRLFRALQELLDALRVGVLVLEDAQWADDATAEFVLFLAAQRPPRVSVVVTYRPEDLAEDSLLPRLAARLSPGFTQVRLRLGPLTVAETTALASSMVHGQPVSAGLAAFLHEGTDGLPLAVEESVRLMHDRAELVNRGDGWSRRRSGASVIPPTVRDAVLERVRRLDPRAQMILRAVAVLAEATDPAIVRAVSSLPPGDAAAGLEQALRSALMVVDSRGLVAFHHALAGRAVYDGMPTWQRREVHLRVGRALEDVVPIPVARLARHFREAGEHSEWCRYAEQAVDQALAAGDDGLATATLCELVVRIDQTPGALLRMVKKYISMAPVGHEQLRDLAHSLRFVLDSGRASPNEAAQLRVQLGRILFNLQQYEAGRAKLEQAVTHPGLNVTDRARAMILLGWPFESSQPAWVHRRWLRRAGEVVARAESQDRRGMEIDRATGLLVLGEDMGWPAVAAIDEASATLLPSQRIMLDLNVGDLAMMWGRFAESRRRLTHALQAAELHEYPRLHGMVLVNLARLDWFCGTWGDLHERASSLASDQDLLPAIRSEAGLVAGLLGSVTGSGTDPRSELESALASPQQLDPRFTVESVGALARLMLNDGDVDAALAVTEEPVSMLTGRGVWIWGTDLVPARVAALLAAGRAGDAVALTAGFARGLRGRDAPGPRASLLSCRAMLAGHSGSPVRAAAMFEAAASAWALLPRPYWALLARERRAGCLLAAGELEQALAQLSQVAQGLAALGAHREADRVERVLRDHDVVARPARRRGRPSYGRALSPREWEVVDLVADGRSNGQIAETLRLSPHTVRMHVKSAMRKLEAPSRGALSERAAQLRDAASGGHQHLVPMPGH